MQELEDSVEDFEQAEFEVVVAVDNFKPVAETYRRNFPNTEVIVKDIQLITGEKIKRICGVRQTSRFSRFL